MRFVNSGFSICANFDICNYERATLVEDDIPNIRVMLLNHNYTNDIIPNYLAQYDSNRYILKNGADYLFVSRSDVIYLISSHQVEESNNYLLVRSVLKNGLGIASYFHNRVVLHGNVFLQNGNAYAIIAPSGYGKSTLTAAMMKYQGATLLSEDSVYINGIKVYSGLRDLYLYDDSSVGIFGKTGKLDGSGKNMFSISANVCSSYNLKGIFILKRDLIEDRFYCKEIKHPLLLKALIDNLRYRNVIYESHLINSIAVLAEAAKTVPVYELIIKMGYHYLPKQTSEIMDVIQNG